MDFSINLRRLRKRRRTFRVLRYLYWKLKIRSSLKKNRGWKKVSITFDFITLSFAGQELRLSYFSADLLLKEWQNVWERFYLPDFNLGGKTVLDVGAGCGETAFFYLLHGAVKVICVEPNEEYASLLKENAERNNWNVEIIPASFSLQILQHRKVDFLKMDCEGCESELLTFSSSLPPLVVEVHEKALRDLLRDRYDLYELAVPGESAQFILASHKNKDSVMSESRSESN